MGKRMIVGLVCVALLAVGCAALQQAKRDVESGNVILAEQGTSATAEGAKFIDPLLPFVPEPLKPFVGWLPWVIGVVIARQTGKRARKGQPTAAPITGFGGKLAGFELVIQEAVNVIAGIFRVIEYVGAKGKSAATVVLPVKPSE